MQEDTKEKKQNGFRIEALPTEDGRNFVDAFAWLIRQDKKQNPALYQLKTEKHD